MGNQGTSALDQFKFSSYLVRLQVIELQISSFFSVIAITYHPWRSILAVFD
jgi:hypothetical protein